MIHAPHGLSHYQTSRFCDLYYRRERAWKTARTTGPASASCCACHRSHHDHVGVAYHLAVLSPGSCPFGPASHPSAGHSWDHTGGHATAHVADSLGSRARRSGAVFWSGLYRPGCASVFSLRLCLCCASAYGSPGRRGAHSDRRLCGLVSGPCLRWPVFRRCRTLDTSLPASLVFNSLPNTFRSPLRQSHQCCSAAR